MPKRPEDDTSAASERGEMGDFSKRLRAARQEAGLEPKPPAPPPPAGLAAYALRLATELVAGVLVGGVVGWLIFERLRPSPGAPIAFIVCLGLGTAGGIWNIVRAVKQMNARIEAYKPVPGEGRDEDDDAN
jgi:ATP synthase protein I